MKRLYNKSKKIKSTLYVSIIGILFVFAAFLLSLMIGPFQVSPKTIVETIFHYESTKEQVIVHDVRLPRAIITALVGANLAVAGSIMQVLTRNALASPGIFGINAGASCVIVCCIVLFPAISGVFLMLAGFLGRERFFYSLQM